MPVTHTRTHRRADGGGGCGVETTRGEGGLRDGIEVEGGVVEG